jgi:hypothetical protein
LAVECDVPRILAASPTERYSCIVLRSCGRPPTQQLWHANRIGQTVHAISPLRFPPAAALVPRAA